MIATPATELRPRLAFLGAGWIGCNRLEAVASAGAAEIAAVADPAASCRDHAGSIAPTAARLSTYDELLDRELDGVVIATPSALHAEQSLRALERGLGVFSQKPLARTGREAREVVEVARRADRLLGVDFCYPTTAAARALRDEIRRGALGEVFAADLVFHNAYGPDKPWFYDRRAAGGGCLMDLGIHLVDLALWLLDRPVVTDVRARLFTAGKALRRSDDAVEDYAVAELTCQSGAVVRIACSWRLPAGRDAVIEASVYGTEGGAAMRNLDGSFYDFVAEHYRGTSTERLTAPPDAWGGRAILGWVDELAGGGGYSTRAEDAVAVAEILDVLYREGMQP